MLDGTDQRYDEPTNRERHTLRYGKERIGIMVTGRNSALSSSVPGPAPEL